MAVQPVSIQSRLGILVGHPQTGERVTILPANGPKLLFHREFLNNANNNQRFRKPIEELNADTKLNSGLYGAEWSQNLMNVWSGTETLKSILDKQSVTHMDDSILGRGFQTVAKMIAAHEERKTNRDVFSLTQGGFDMHSQLKSGLNDSLSGLNSALQAFYDELVSQNLLDKVTVVIGSEFGRTLTPNTGDGSDHGWGGNYFMFGGELKGGKILGKYPESFHEADETNIGRGRLLPTLSWDAMWYGVSQWFGITDGEDMQYVLPNNENFGCDLFSDTDLYATGANTIPGCEESTRAIEVQISLFIPEPRYLTGMEQKDICAAVIEKMSDATGSRTKCIVKDQSVTVSYGRQRWKYPPSYNNISYFIPSQQQSVGNKILDLYEPFFSFEFTPEVTTVFTNVMSETDAINLIAEAAKAAAETIMLNATTDHE